MLVPEIIILLDIELSQVILSSSRMKMRIHPVLPIAHKAATCCTLFALA
jgi:hypothetical protein